MGLFLRWELYYHIIIIQYYIMDYSFITISYYFMITIKLNVTFFIFYIIRFLYCYCHTIDL